LVLGGTNYQAANLEALINQQVELKGLDDASGGRHRFLLRVSQDVKLVELAALISRYDNLFAYDNYLVLATPRKYHRCALKLSMREISNDHRTVGEYVRSLAED